MACGGESGMDACRAGEHPPAGTPLFPKPVHGSGGQHPQSGEDPKKRARRPVTKERSEEHTSELQSLMRISYAVFCLKKKKINKKQQQHTQPITKTTTMRPQKHN